MLFSQRLKDRIAAALENDREHDCLSDQATDLTSTAGYDNDGSIGPDLIENGVTLGLQLAEHRAETNTEATVFFANDPQDETRYYQIGTTEADALARLEAALAE